MAQDGPKIGPSWGHVGLQNRLEWVQERKKATPKTGQETSSKTTEKTEAPATAARPRRGAAPSQNGLPRGAGGLFS